MNDNIAIEVKGLGKEFIINHKNKASYNTIKDDFANLIRRPFGRAAESTEEKFWALRDVNFEVPKGEIFGVIGQNGSGKSTLLKIMSKIIEPSEGTITMRGRVSSLLEVGTGFHPELTGRENVFFNGSMLGMSKKEIGRKFDEIVSFSEIEKFIDTPVKFYSSGMYVRLAFSVAAHLDPDILILDEVLAVGDAGFQQKSLKKILETMQSGKTVLFVSHSMSSVRQLCSHGIMLDHGGVVAQGPVDQIIEAYTLETEHKALGGEIAIGPEWKRGDETADDEVCVPLAMYITDAKGNKVTDALNNSEDYYVNIEIDIKKKDPMFTIGYSLWDDAGRNLLYQTVSTDTARDKWPETTAGVSTYRAKLPNHSVNAGDYKIRAIASLYGKRWILDPDASQVKLAFHMRHGKQASEFWPDMRGGIFAPLIEWEKL